jgi:hypothetical protein
LGRRTTRAPAVGRALPNAGGAELDYAVEKGALSPVRDPPWRRCLEGGPELLLLECWRRPSRSSMGGAGGAAAFAPAVRCPFPPSSGCSFSSSPPADVPWPRATVDPDLRPLLSCPAAAEQERGAQVAAVHVGDSPGGAEATRGGAATRASGAPRAPSTTRRLAHPCSPLLSRAHPQEQASGRPTVCQSRGMTRRPAPHLPRRLGRRIDGDDAELPHGDSGDEEPLFPACL